MAPWPVRTYPDQDLKTTGDTAPPLKDVCMPEEQPPSQPDDKIGATSAEQASWSWARTGQGDGPARRALPRGEDFRRTVGFTVLGTLVPGAGLIAAGRKVVGSVVLGVFVLALAVVGVAAAVDREALVQIGVDPVALRRLAIGLVVVAALWVGVVVATHLSLRHRPTRSQRVVGGVLVGVLAFAVAAPMAVAARTAYVSAGLVGSVFKSSGETRSATRPTLVPTNPGDQEQQQDPWADQRRLNVLLLGGDDGKGRVGTRTDTVILASIDTKTGDTTLFSLPRNTARMPFPPGPLRKYYPNGFTDGNGENAEFFLNAMYRDVPATVPKDVIGDTDNLGADVMKLSVGQALGLKVDYYVLINLQGFSTLIDALGGIRLNVNTYIPIGGNTDLNIPPKGFIKPGPNQKLDGRSALWYARGRFGSDDFARMDRQRCVINAMIKQANPTNVLTRYEDIANASKSLVRTDIPQEVLPSLVDLSLRVKGGNVRSVVFRNGENGFYSANPDFSQMRSRVKKAIGEAKDDTTPKKTTSSGGGTGSGSGKAPTSEDVDSSCRYDPKIAATARPYTG
jgi:polyisoprenyl-teichoic acid--peptidoglycan teichoic acid transferase